ncbi:hypothetical protein NL108_007976, partial [Boleophthalmus pectinirostris]
KKSITVILLLCAVVSLSNGFCFVKEDLKPGEDNIVFDYSCYSVICSYTVVVLTIPPGATHCMNELDGSWHPVGSSWIDSECMECTCFSCCST